MPLTLYTIGHSNHPAEKFVALLRGAGIARLADVRSIPYSRRWPQFRREALDAALAAAGIEYVWYGEALGGRPRDAGAGRKPDYARIAARPDFGEALARLIGEAAQRPTALMCAERDPLDCHRFHLLARPLVERGAALVHLLADGGRETQAEAEARMARRDPQARLFD
jgi:uncharacterized protein (DUF488 family)